MHFSSKSAALLCLCFLGVLAAFGQEVLPCQQRTMIANVVDDRGITPTDLTRENFKIAYKGRTANPLSVVYTDGPRRVVVLLDVSGSMNRQGTGKWEVARAAAGELVAALPPGSKASLTTFSEKTEIRAAMSVDRGPLRDWLNGESARPSPHGHTAMYAAIQSAIEQLQPPEPGDAIYIITDGGRTPARCASLRSMTR